MSARRLACIARSALAMGALAMGALAVVAPLGCGGDDAGAPAADAGRDETSVADAAVSKLGRITVNVVYTGSRKGQIAIGAFTEAVPKNSPPVTFDTSKVPTFPYAATLSDLEPGDYWIVALLDFEPFSGAAVKPGPEDVSKTSSKVTVAAGETRSVELTLSDDLVDAGASDAASD